MALGWHKYDMDIRQRVALTGREVIGSMGYTGPLAALAPESLPNIADFCKENVAVVTNPAIDREREAEHFTTRTVLGSRPSLDEGPISPLGLELRTPLLLEGETLAPLLAAEKGRELALRFGAETLEKVVDFFTYQGRDPARVALLDTTFDPEAGLANRLAELCSEAAQAATNGALLLILDDRHSFGDGRVFIDPALVVAAVSDCLAKNRLRRQTSIVVRSAAVRNLHDIMLLLGLGVDAVSPYLLWRISCELADESHPPELVMQNTMDVLQKGMEKVMSTMGIHELCGYGRVFSAIGLTQELAAVMQLPNFCAAARVGLGYEQLEALARKRLALAASGTEAKIYQEPARNPRVGRVLRNVAIGKTGYLEMAAELEKIEEELPTGLRHLLSIKSASGSGQRQVMNDVDLSIGRHDLPLVIAAMSFGSQGESSFRAYAAAAKKVNRSEERRVGKESRSRWSPYH